MRALILLLAVLIAGCASSSDPPTFSAGQVWRLRDRDFGAAMVTIGSVEQRRDRAIVHVSVAGLPAPPPDTVLFEGLRRDAEDRGRGPLHFIASGLTDASGRWSLLTVDLSLSSDRAHTAMAVPHVAVYDEDLRASVSRLEQAGPPLHSMFPDQVRLWRDSERRWPELNDEELERPFRERMTSAIEGAAALASDEDTTSWFGPPPPAWAEIGESVIDEPEFDARCRGIVAPGPLDARIVSRLLEHGVPMEEIPEIDVTLSNIVVTESERWGQIWRADAHGNRSPSDAGSSRAVCWRRNADEEPAVTFYPPSSQRSSSK